MHLNYSYIIDRCSSAVLRFGGGPYLDWFDVDLNPSTYYSLPISLPLVQELPKEDEYPERLDGSQNVEDKLLELMCRYLSRVNSLLNDADTD